jgi:hypothetical protein
MGAVFFFLVRWQILPIQWTFGMLYPDRKNGEGICFLCPETFLSLSPSYGRHGQRII